MGKLVRQIGSIERHLHKNAIVDLAKENAQAILVSGKYDLLKVFVELKRYETYLKGLIQCLKQPVLDKATEKKKKSFEYDEAKVHISIRTRWDFTVDGKWVELDQKIQQLTLEKKEREKYLINSSKVRTVVDKETGEIVEEFELPNEILYGLTITL
jgi:hypothetical protein